MGTRKGDPANCSLGWCVSGTEFPVAGGVQEVSDGEAQLWESKGHILARGGGVASQPFPWLLRWRIQWGLAPRIPHTGWGWPLFGEWVGFTGGQVGSGR